MAESARKKKTLFDGLSRQQLTAMLEAGAEIHECYRVLKKTSSNIVAELLRNQGTFYEWNHYPSGDAVDWETHSQYYYHAHQPEEHGHFHIFMRYKGIPKSLRPAPLEVSQKENKDRIGAHLIAVSMDGNGFPIKLFTVNRWVTDETWYKADDVITMLDGFAMDHTYPSWATNRWLTAIMILFRPQICELIRARDEVMAVWRKKDGAEDVYEDRALELTSEAEISVEKQLALVRKARQPISVR